MRQSLVIELFCGCFGWSAGFLDQGYRSVGFDICHEPYHGPVPAGADLVIQDVLTLHGSQFKEAAVILASPPCTEYSFMAMPFTRGKQIAAALRGKGDFPENYTGSRTIPQLTTLFDACFRIQREACEATCHCQCHRCLSGGHCVRCDYFGNTGKYARYIPMIVENVRGAQPWVGRAKANYGGFYLYGDVEQVGKRIVVGPVRFGAGMDLRVAAAHEIGQKSNRDGTDHPSGSWFKIADSKERGVRKGTGHKLSEKGFNVSNAQRYREEINGNGYRKGDCGGWWASGNHDSPSSRPREFLKRQGVTTQFKTRADSRKAASAHIARIPYALSYYVASALKPC